MEHVFIVTVGGERNGPFGTLGCNCECDDRLKYKLMIYFYIMKHKMSFRIVDALNLSKSPLRITTINSLLLPLTNFAKETIKLCTSLCRTINIFSHV